MNKHSFQLQLCSIIVINCSVIGACFVSVGLVSWARALRLKKENNQMIDSADAEILFLFIINSPFHQMGNFGQVAEFRFSVNK